MRKMKNKSNPYIASAFSNISANIKDDPYFNKDHPYHKLTKYLAEAYGSDTYYKKIAKERRIKTIKYIVIGLFIFILGVVLGGYF